MPIQLTVMERRDNADRRELGNTVLALCRAARARDGITSSKFYWYWTDTIVVVTEGETAALDAPGTAAPEEYARAGFALADMARLVMNWRLAEPRAGEETYRRAGR